MKKMFNLPMVALAYGVTDILWRIDEAYGTQYVGRWLGVLGRMSDPEKLACSAAMWGALVCLTYTITQVVRG